MVIVEVIRNILCESEWLPSRHVAIPEPSILYECGFNHARVSHRMPVLCNAMSSCVKNCKFGAFCPTGSFTSTAQEGKTTRGRLKSDIQHRTSHQDPSWCLLDKDLHQEKGLLREVSGFCSSHGPATCLVLALLSASCSTSAVLRV